MRNLTLTHWNGPRLCPLSAGVERGSSLACSNCDYITAIARSDFTIPQNLRGDWCFMQAKIKQAEANLAAAENAVSNATRSLSESNHLLATERQKCRELSSRLGVVEDEERKARGCLQDLRGKLDETKKDLHAQLREAQYEVNCT